MTAIGKMLTFLVLLLSLGWFYLTVNAYVARTNWRAEADRSAKELTKQQQSADTAARLIVTDRDAAEDARKALVAERDRLASQVTQLTADRRALEEQYTLAFSDAQKKGAAAVQQQANINKLNLEVKTKDDQLAANLAALNALTLAAEKSKADAASARLAQTAAEKAAETLRATVAQLQSDLEIARRPGGGAGGLGAQRFPPPVNFSAVVTQFVSDRNVIQINNGGDAGLRVGAVLSVSRINPNGGGQYLGSLTITEVDPKSAAGLFAPANLNRQRTANDNPRVGDQITAK